jgi:hypothetical protein
MGDENIVTQYVAQLVQIKSEGSDDGILLLILLGLWTFTFVWYSNQK